VRHLSCRHRELDITIFIQLLGDLIVRRQCHTAHEVVCSVRTWEVKRTILYWSAGVIVLCVALSQFHTLSFFWQPRHSPYYSSVVMFVLGLTRCHFDQMRFEIVHCTEESIDTFHFTRPVRIIN
jgi:hypothetical protein